MYRNRVNPFGDIIAIPERGAWLGNRGVIHNHRQEIIRPFRLKAWITCQLQFKARHREIMMPDRWTELFFMDEATAFSAGHRPCAECRRTDFNRFKHFWLLGNPQAGFTLRTPIAEIDAVIHAERIDAKKTKATHREAANQLPEGTMITIDQTAYLKKGDHFFRWTPAGYTAPMTIGNDIAEVLTPASIVNAFRAGYVPQTGVLLSH